MVPRPGPQAFSWQTPEHPLVESNQAGTGRRDGDWQTKGRTAWHQVNHHRRIFTPRLEAWAARLRQGSGWEAQRRLPTDQQPHRHIRPAPQHQAQHTLAVLRRPASTPAASPQTRAQAGRAARNGTGSLIWKHFRWILSRSRRRLDISPSTTPAKPLGFAWLAPRQTGTASLRITRRARQRLRQQTGGLAILDLAGHHSLTQLPCRVPLKQLSSGGGLNLAA